MYYSEMFLMNVTTIGNWKSLQTAFSTAFTEIASTYRVACSKPLDSD